MPSSPFTSPLFVTPGLARQVTLQQRAHFMRFHPTPWEALLWSRLRGRRLGVRFLRQVVIGSYIVDFLAPAAGLVVEQKGVFLEIENHDPGKCGFLICWDRQDESGTT